MQACNIRLIEWLQVSVCAVHGVKKKKQKLQPRAVTNTNKKTTQHTASKSHATPYPQLSPTRHPVFDFACMQPPVNPQAPSCWSAGPGSLGRGRRSRRQQPLSLALLVPRMQGAQGPQAASPMHPVQGSGPAPAPPAVVAAGSQGQQGQGMRRG